MVYLAGLAGSGVEARHPADVVDLPRQHEATVVVGAFHGVDARRVRLRHLQVEIRPDPDGRDTWQRSARPAGIAPSTALRRPAPDRLYLRRRQRRIELVQQLTLLRPPRGHFPPSHRPAHQESEGARVAVGRKREGRDSSEAMAAHAAPLEDGPHIVEIRGARRRRSAFARSPVRPHRRSRCGGRGDCHEDENTQRPAAHSQDCRGKSAG